MSTAVYVLIFSIYAVIIACMIRILVPDFGKKKVIRVDKQRWERLRGVVPFGHSRAKVISIDEHRRKREINRENKRS